MHRATRFRRHLTQAGIILVLLLAGIFWYSFRTIKRADSTTALIVHTQEVLKNAERLRLLRASLRNNYWAYAYSHDPNYRDTFATRKQELEELLTRLQRLTVDNPEQQKILAQLTPLLLAESQKFTSSLDLLSAQPRGALSRPHAPGDISLAIPAPDQPRRLIDVFENNETLLFNSRAKALEQSAHISGRVLLVAGAFCLALLLTSGHLIQREIIKRATVEIGLRRAQEILGVRLEEQRSELGQAIEDLHSQMLARKAADEKLRRLNDELEARVQARTAQLEELNRELEAFTYSVSHDLRAPLRHMDGFSRILQDDFSAHLPEEAKHYLLRIRTAATNMSHLVEDLLQLSRVGRQLPRCSRISLDAILAEAKNEVLQEANGRKIEWRIHSLPELEADPVLMRQVFANLLSNAVKFTRNVESPVIEVGSTRDKRNETTIFVKDNGAGFDPRYADKLFGVFQRLHRQDEFEGTGIGLATVQRIIHKHGGRIWAESTPGQGATFSFFLPATVPAQVQEFVGATA